MRYRIIISSPAQHDFREVKSYIARDSLLAAERFANLLSSKIKILGMHPEIGRKVPDFQDPTVREIIVKSYRVVYKIDSLNKQIKIMRYWHAARGVPKIR